MERSAVVAMSGGVDSAVAAVLLCESGWKCTGATLRLARGDARDDSHACCTLDDTFAARAAARALGMPHYVFNETDAFEREVVARFAAGYLAGETPNPCLDCNRRLKFGALLRRAPLLGCSAVATGHYARVAYSKTAGRWQLKKALDPAKDQSYVLYMLSQEQLAHTLLPLGGLQKGQVRALAAAHGLACADKPESQDLCFVPNRNYAGFIEAYSGRKSEPGPLCDTQGRVLGCHRGLVHYTVGQRRGLGISGGEPLYVCAKLCRANTLVAGPRRMLERHSFILREVNWVSIPCPRGCVHAAVRIRCHGRETAAEVTPLPGGLARVDCAAPVYAPAPGQAAVFYDGDLLLGGGVITAPSGFP